MNIDGDSFLYYPFKIFHKIQRNYGKVIISPYNLIVKGHRGHTLVLDLWSLIFETICLFAAPAFHTFALSCYSPCSSMGLHMPLSSSRDPGSAWRWENAAGLLSSQQLQMKVALLASPSCSPAPSSAAHNKLSQNSWHQAHFFFFYITRYSMKNTYKVTKTSRLLT